jgi:hypothetical protein
MVRRVNFMLRAPVVDELATPVTPPDPDLLSATSVSHQCGVAAAISANPRTITLPKERSPFQPAIVMSQLLSIAPAAGLAVLAGLVAGWSQSPLGSFFFAREISMIDLRNLSP